MDQERKKLLVFGYGLAVILSLAGLRWGYKGGFGPEHAVLFLAAGLLAGVTWLAPHRLSGFYRHWMAGTRLVGAVVSTVILAVMFYAVFGSVGCILRLLRKDPLERAICAGKPSYWNRRPDVTPGQEEYKRQF
ncbi:MAG: hypothetical protein WC450_11390 [Candidatus Omnitrophota bacterium]|jgi:hypothetical protein